MDELTSYVIAAQHGDHKAFSQIVMRFQDMAYAVAYAQLGSPEMAEDTAQEAFIEVYRHLAKIENPAAFPGWFYTILRRQCSRVLRQRNTPLVSLETLSAVASLEAEPPMAVELQETQTHILQEIAALPENEREVIALFYIADHSLREIADVLNIQVSTVKNRLFTARNRLRQRMAPMTQGPAKQQRLSKDDTFITRVDLPFLGPKTQGKVRDIYARGDHLILVTTDRLSAFDRMIGLVPYKGQTLNQLAAFWFEQTQDILPNHLLELPDPNVAVVRTCTPLPVEVVVRGYISGVTSTALWYRYSQGERNIYGIDFPDGLNKNDLLPTPVITPTTKAREGGHDERITSTEVVSSGLVERSLWEQVQEAAIAIFLRGQEIAQRGGLILVDTKYEFGVDAAGKLTLIDEVHTPDSSRFWRADSYPSRHSVGEEPENFDKEFVRLYYVAQGYRGDGETFPLPPDLAVQAAERYITSYEMISGHTFVPGELPAAPRIAQAMKEWARRSL